MTKRGKNENASESDGKAKKGKRGAKGAEPYPFERDIVFQLRDERQMALHLAWKGVSPNENMLKAESIGIELMRIHRERAKEKVARIAAKYKT